MENFTAADDRTVIELFLNIVRTAVPFLTLYSHIKKKILTFWGYRRNLFFLARGKETLDQHLKELTRFEGFYDTAISRRAHYKYP